jgi:hypothetical protein
MLLVISYSRSVVSSSSSFLKKLNEGQAFIILLKLHFGIC